MARLAKEWNSKVRFDGYISGRSTIFELIGIKAGRDEEMKKRNKGMDPSLENAFRRFVGRVGDFYHQGIAFYEFYDKSIVPNHVIRQKPFLLDTSNPYNNLLHKFPIEAFPVFITKARRSQSQLAKIKDVSDLERLF